MLVARWAPRKTFTATCESKVLTVSKHVHTGKAPERTIFVLPSSQIIVALKISAYPPLAKLWYTGALSEEPDAGSSLIWADGII